MYTSLWIIYFIGIIAWIFPALKQYKTKYFIFFLIFAIEDPLIFILYSTTHIVPQSYMHFIMRILTIISLFQWNSIKKYAYLIFPLIIIVLLFINDSIIEHGYDMNALINIIILVILFQHFTVDIRDTGCINMFFIVMVLYSLSLILKFIFRDEFKEIGPLYFWASSAFQTLIAIYFSFYNVNNSKKFTLFKAEGIA